MAMRVSTTAVVLLALWAPGIALAQSSAATTTAPTGAPTVVTQMKPDEMRVSKIIGKNVYGPDDKSVGDVSDLVLDKDGKITTVVLSIGGFLGLGDKRVAVPMSELKLGANDHLTVNLTEDQLKDAPEFRYAEHDGDRARSGSSSPPR